MRRRLKLCDAPTETRARILALTEAAHNEAWTWPDMLGDASHLQGIAQEREAGPRLIRDRLWEASVVGDQAIELLRQIR